MSFRNDKEIIDDLIKDIDRIESEKNVFLLIPEIIIMIQKHYKHLIGKTKQSIALKVIEHYAIKQGMTVKDIESLLIISPFMIDGMIIVGKNAGDLFKKTKKSCVSCFKK